MKRLVLKCVAAWGIVLGIAAGVGFYDTMRSETRTYRDGTPSIAPAWGVAPSLAWGLVIGTAVAACVVAPAVMALIDGEED